MAALSLVPSVYFNIKLYGAVCDGIHDDTSAIASTLAALGPSDGTIIISGTCKVTSTISYSLSANQHVIIEGVGNAKIVSTIAEPGGESGIFAFTGDSGATARLTIRNLVISHTNSGLGNLDGIYVQPLNYGSGGTQSLANIELDNVRITGASLYGCRLLGVLGGKISNCLMNSNRNAGLGLTGCIDIEIEGGDYSSNVTGGLTGDYGITLTSSSLLPYSKNILFEGVQANNNGRKGIDVHHGHNIHMFGNTTVGNGYCGIYAVMEDSTKDVGDITIIGNTIDQTGGNNTLINYCINVGTFGTTGALSPGAFIVSNNTINGVDAGAATSAAIRVMSATTGAAPDRVVITDNTIKKGSGSSGWPILTDNALAIPYLEIANNIIHTASCAQGVIVQAATDVVCTGNDLRIDGGTPTYGINIVSTANALVTSNQINGQAPSTLAITNTSTTHLVRANTQNGVALADTARTAPFTVTGGLTVDAFGHLLSLATGTPTLTAVNANVVNQVVSGNDVRGTITFDIQTGTLAAASALFTVNFAQAYGSAPVPMTTNASNQTTSAFYVTAQGTSTFVVRNSAALAVLTGYKINYMAMG